MGYNVKRRIRQTFRERPFVVLLKDDKDGEKFLKFLDSLSFTCRDGRPCIELRPHDYPNEKVFVYVGGTITWCDCYVNRVKYPTLIKGARNSIRFIKDTVSKLCT